MRIIRFNGLNWHVPRSLAALLIALLVLLPAASSAAPTRIPGVQAEMSTFEDASAQLTLADILSMQNRFTPRRNFNADGGYSASALWVRFTIFSPQTQALLLSLSPNFVDFIDVYVDTSGSGEASQFKTIAMGDHRPLPDDHFSGLDNVVPLDLAAGISTTVYIRLLGVNSATSISADLYSSSEHTMRNTSTSLAVGLWFGGMATLIVIQLVFFSADRRMFYLLVASSTLGAMLVYCGTAGLSRLLLFPQGGVGNDLFTALSVWFGEIVTSMAIASVFELRSKNLFAFRAAQASVGVGICGAIAAIAGYHRLFAPYGSIAMIVVATIVLVESGRQLRGAGLDARLKAVAFLLLWLGLVITLTQRVGVLGMPEWVGHAYAVSNLLYTLLLTGALGVRMRAAEIRNNAMRAEALIAAEAARQRANLMVEERTRELAEAKAVAEDALQAELASQQQQVRFMEVISHQYRTPLAGLRSNVESIGLSLPAADAANRERLDRVRSSILRLVEVLEVNLARSRLQGPSFQPGLVATPVGEIIRAAASRGRDLLQQDIEIEIAPGAASVEVLADADMLGVAIINLLENAAKFSAGKGRPPVKLTSALDGGEVAISVIDKGIGIPRDEIAGIFAGAVRGSNATHIPGTGNGLSLVSRIVSAHGGGVAVDSMLGEGTTVRITLPVRPV